MNSALESKLRQLPKPYLTESDLALLLEGTPDSRYGKVKRLLAQGKLLHIRRGLYCITELLGYQRNTHPFELAQRIYSPSYISLESALSFHGLIPEAVYTTTSVCAKRSKEFQTPLGLFSYLSLPTESFYTEVTLLTEGEYTFYVAKPWKAICDYVYCYKKDWNKLNTLLESLRIERDALPLLRLEEMDVLMDYYRHKRITRFLTCIKREMD